MKLGTYGIIKGANYYLAVACKKSNYDLEESGLKGEIKMLSGREDNKYKYVASWIE